MQASKPAFITTIRQDDGSAQLVCSGCMGTWISYSVEDAASKHAAQHARACHALRPDPALAEPRKENVL